MNRTVETQLEELLQQRAQRIGPSSVLVGAALREGRRIVRRRRIASATAASISVAAIVVVSAGLPWNGSAPGEGRRPERAIPADAPAPTAAPRTELRRSDPANNVRWEVVSYDSPVGDCLDVVGASLVTTDVARLTGCGPRDGPMRWLGGAGGADIDGQWFNIAYGVLPVDASEVEITSEAGSTTWAAVSGDVWFLALPDDSALGLAGAPKRITARDSTGEKVAAVILRLAEKRRAGVQAGVEESD